MIAFRESIIKASLDDVDRIVELVNTAYRCKNNPGWTSESDIIEGARTNSVDVMALLAPPKSEVFIVKDKDRVVACVHLEKDNDRACVGMLAIDPVLQGRGLGSILLEYVEAFARDHFLVKKAVMCVIAQRTELVDYYLRRGYSSEGEVCEYPRHLNIGMPVQEDLVIQYLNKNL
ncbi:MAG: GNAT family N-acetyltransferase [Gammaproteobacteria bacterium]|nr:GNAT family N-acetyltransferase [Gammaproteobacteria bacterium]